MGRSAITMKDLYYLIVICLFVGFASQAFATDYSVHPIGYVVKNSGKVTLDILPQYREALSGLKDFSHIYVFYWFDRNDSLEKRSILKVHPRGNKENPLTGVFATHAPVRPNLIGLSICKIESIDDGVITINGIDAFDGTPIIDLKPYRPSSDCFPDASVASWVNTHKGNQH